MRKATIGAILFALSCWAYPISTTAQAYVKTSPQTIPEVHDQSTAKNVDADTSGRSQENESGIKEEVNEPTRTSIQSSNHSSKTTPSNPVRVYSGRDYSKEEVQQLIKDYSAQYGIPADLPLRVAACESGFNQASKNRSSTASGVFQYLASTWRNTDAGKSGISVFDADANVHMAIKSIARGGISNWNASRSCWSK